MLNLDQIVVLDAVIHTGSFRGASEKLRRAQSAVSYAIKNLEQDLGFDLFDRDSYRAKLTPKGKAIYQKAQSLISGVEEIRELGAQLSQGDEAQISLGITAVFPLPPILDKIADFSKKKPSVQLRVSMEVLAAEDKVLDGSSDLAISELTQKDPMTFFYKRLGSVPMTPVASKEHPIVRSRKKKLNRSEISKHIQIVLKSTSNVENERSAGIFEGTLTWPVSDFYTKKEFLKKGLGWGFMPNHLVDEELKTGSLRSFEIQDVNELAVDMYLFRKRQKPMGPAFRLLWNALDEEF